MVIKGAVIFGQARSSKRRADSGTRDGITTSQMERLMNVLLAAIASYEQSLSQAHGLSGPNE